MHLVVREPPSSQPSLAPSSVRAQSPSPARQPINPQRPNPAQAPFGLQPPSGFPRWNPVQPATGAFPPPGATQPAPAANSIPDPAAAFQQQHHAMSSWLTHLQREAMNRAMANQNQRSRATMGMPGGHGPGQQEPHSGRASPALGHYYRETTGPNGQLYQVETIIRGPGPSQAGSGSSGGLSPAEVHSMLRSADMTQATAAMTNAMHRSASGASLHSLYNRPLNQPGVTTAAHPLSDSRAPSGRGTPDPGARSVSGGSQAHAAGSSTSQPRQGADVYIISSPEGPRALLVNNNASETYYTPRLPIRPAAPRLSSMISPVSTTPGTPLPGRDETQHNAQHGEQQPQDPAPNQLGQAHPPLPDGQADPDNPNEAGLPPLLMQMWPHIWLIFRLGVFIWFFTNPQSTWSRWFSVVGIAVFIFIVSIGGLQSLADLAWRPVAQQLENMLPGLEQPPQRREGAQGQNRDPDPGEMAARLVAQRGNWLQGQIRRLERASLLFLASIAPGVAERHIANLEAEARAERQRREAEAAEAARRREEEEEEANADTNGGPSGVAAGPEPGQEPEGSGSPRAEGQEDGGAGREQGMQQPLNPMAA